VKGSKEVNVIAMVNTFCIEKSSLAELLEALNSMFTWYRDAAVCYVYLSDVRGDGDLSSKMKEFPNSVWFPRGWTLQDLIASTVVIFAQDWSEIGSRSVLLEQVTRATGIDRDLFSIDVIIADWDSESKYARQVQHRAENVMGIQAADHHVSKTRHTVS
jgi:hypothetical protein